jgi:hypothetical protein
VTGRASVAAVGFAERPDGSLAVAAGSPDADWALNLLTEPRCEVLDGAAPGFYLARLLDPAEHALAVRELILKYGGPAERLGVGPAFALVPTTPTREA